MVHFAEINQASSLYSMLQYIGRVATPKLVRRNYLRYLQTTLIMGKGGSVSEFMEGIVGWQRGFDIYALNKYFVGIKLKKYSILSNHINKWHVLADVTSLKCCFLKAVVFPCCLTLTSMTYLLH